MASQDIRPFTLSIPDSSLKLVQDKLSQATFPRESDFNDDWASGVPLSDMKRLVEHWKNGFDWREQERKINQLPLFETKIDVDGFGELDIVFLHQRSARKGSVPLLFCHGWPGNILEVTKILPLLTNPDDEDEVSFHVVAPCLPNHGFSDFVTKKDFSVPQYAEVMHKVMLKLGYDKYVTQGGDWGFMITRAMAILYPESVMAQHLNWLFRMAMPSFWTTPYLFLKTIVWPWTPAERNGIARAKDYQESGSAYQMLQGFQPSTIGLALADSPVALLSWIYEKLHLWTDSYPWTDDEILLWTCMYQFSKAGAAASVRIYTEVRRSGSETTQRVISEYVNIPLGVSNFPRDVFCLPKTFAQAMGPVVYIKYHDKGGHFAAHETPELLAEDIRATFGVKGGEGHKAAMRAVKD